MESASSNPSQVSTSQSKMTLQEKASYAGYSIPVWSAMPTIDYGFDVIKKGCLVETINIHQQPFYLIGIDCYCAVNVLGRNADVCDIVPEHPSLSRIHAVIQHGKEGRLEVLDFKSTHGTFLNGNQIKAFTYTPLHVGDYLQFGGSMRMYTLTGPSEMMQPEQEIKIERSVLQEKKVEEKKQERKYKVDKLNIVYLGEKKANPSYDRDMFDRSRLDDDEGIENDASYSILDGELERNDLTENEKAQLKRIEELKNKREKMAANPKWKNKNENREETLQKLTNDIEELEQTLYDTIERRVYKESHQRGLRERRLDEEDSYFDRTNRKKKEVSRPESRDILVEKLAYKKKLLSYYESQLNNMNPTTTNETPSEDPLDQYMQMNEKKMNEMKMEMITSKLAEVRKDISEITTKIAQLPKKEEIPVLHLKSPEKKKDSRDTSTFRVIDETTEKKKSPSASAMAASFGSVMDQLTSGKNHSFDQEESQPVHKSTPTPISMNVPKAPRMNEKRKATQQSQSSENESGVIPMEEKRRDMSEYYVPEDMNVAINRDALEDVKKEMGDYQPTFIRRMFDELKDKYSVCSNYC